LLEKTLKGLPDQPTIMLQSIHYDEAGQMESVQVGSTEMGGAFLPFIQKIDYEFNIKGWLTDINDPDNTTTENDIFAMKLHYADALSMVTSQLQYNGNISAFE
jgi:hypothetical protein